MRGRHLRRRHGRMTLRKALRSGSSRPASNVLARDPEANARAVALLASPELAGELPARWEEPKRQQTVRSAVVSGAVAVDVARRALVTLAATVAARRVSTRLVTVPVARDAGGGLVVYDLPSFGARAGAGHGRARVGWLLGSEGAEVRDVLTRFLRAYLARDADGLTYLVPPGTRIGAATGGFELVELGSVAVAGARESTSRLLVLATVQARDVQSRAVYALRFRVAPPPRSLVRGGPRRLRCRESASVTLAIGNDDALAQRAGTGDERAFASSRTVTAG